MSTTTTTTKPWLLCDDDPLRPQREAARIDSYARIIRDCGERGDLSRTRRVEASVYTSELRHNRLLVNLLIEAYGKCSSASDASAAFARLRRPNVYSWTLLVLAYARCGRLDDARLAFDAMPSRDLVVWNAMVQAYAAAGRPEDAAGVFKAMPELSLVAATSVVAAFAFAGHLEEARRAFDAMPQRDIIAWNAMLSGYSQHGRVENARRIFEAMPERDLASWTSLVAAYAGSGHWRFATEVFRSSPEKDDFAWGAMLKAYCSRGRPDRAMTIFEQMPHRDDVVVWTSVLVGYAHSGDGATALGLFSAMLAEGIDVDGAAMLGALVACGAAGSIDCSRRRFVSIAFDFGLEPGPEHYCCLVDLLGRAGRLLDAEELAIAMPFAADAAAAWTSLLGSYRRHHLEEGAPAWPDPNG